MDREELQRQLVITFRAELEEHCAALNTGLLELEKELPDEEREELLKSLFRAAHSIKGSARAVELKEISTVAHKMEDVLGAIRKNELAGTSQVVDQLLRATDLLNEAMQLHLDGKTLPLEARKAVMSQLDAALKGELREPEPTEGPRTSHDDTGKTATPQVPPSPPGSSIDSPATQSGPDKTETAPVETDPDIYMEPVEASDSEPSKTPPAKPPEKPETAQPVSVSTKPHSAEETIRVSTEKLDVLMAGMGELLVARMRMEQRLGEMKEIQSFLVGWEKAWRKMKIRKKAVERRAVNDSELFALLDFFSVNESHLRDAGRKMDRLCEWMDGDYRHLSLLTDDMQDGVRRVRMVPVATLFDLFPRMIRDISREQGKKTRLILEGAGTEIDRQVLEGLKDPLTHLLRNAIDHGIEPPEARRQRGKPEEGTIRLKASQRGNHIVLEVSDDGAGINLQAVRRAAVRNHLITAGDAENMGREEAVDLVFQSGLSTHVSVTDLSGRGVGMDVVRDQLEKLHGQVKTLTELDQGTTFTLILPLTLATSHVLMLEVADQVVAAPTTSVERLLQVKPEEIKRMEGKPAVSINGRALPLISMARILALPERETKEVGPEKIAVVVLGAVEKRLAFQVDGFVGAQEVVVKNLGPQLRRVPNISGATILGTGQVVMILNAGSMIHSAQGVKGAGLLKRAHFEEAQAKKVLVVDDSITTRTLEKNILENAGYQVAQAADGMEGWERMQDDTYDAVVFDIEMPRMDGFQLTEKVRRDSRFEHLPIVLVTSLESPEDKLRGMEAGADVYITKGTFDQQELLETIERLIG